MSSGDPSASPTAPPPMDEILASIRRVIAEEPSPLAPPPLPTPEAAADEDVLELGDAPAPAAAPAAAQPAPLLSAPAEEASRQALAALSGLAIDPNAAANTLDGLVRELLRPMLRDWLDAHLPELVERLVAREIARIGGR